MNKNLHEFFGSRGIIYTTKNAKFNNCITCFTPVIDNWYNFKLSKTLLKKSLILLDYLIAKTYIAKREDKFISIHSRTLTKLLTSKYAKVIEELIRLNIIETDSKFYINSKSYGYRLKAHISDICYTHFEYKYGNSYEIIRDDLDDPYKSIHETILATKLSSNYEFTGGIRESIVYNSYIKRNFWGVVDDKTGRFYNLISNMPKRMRTSLTIDDEPVVELDCKCAQPFLLHNLYNECDEKEKYLDLVVNGDFYETIGEYADYNSRKELKKMIFKDILYGSMDCIHSKLWKNFESKFPIMAELLLEYKKIDYKVVSITLQRMESDIFINRIGKRLLESNIKFITIHDAILCKQIDSRVVFEQMKSEFLDVYEIIPKIVIDSTQ